MTQHSLARPEVSILIPHYKTPELVGLCLYLLKKYDLTFDDNNEVAGKLMHKKLVGHGHDMLFLESDELGQYLDHINHVAMVLHPELGTGLKQKAVKKGSRRIQQYFNA